MSQENVEVVRRVFDAFNRGDSSALLSEISPAIVVRQTSPIPDARTYHGHEGFRQVISDWTAVFDQLVMTVEELTEAGDDKVVAHGRIVRLDMFNHKTEALEAAGLSE